MWSEVCVRESLCQRHCRRTEFLQCDLQTRQSWKKVDRRSLSEHHCARKTDLSCTPNSRTGCCVQTSIPYLFLFCLFLYMIQRCTPIHPCSIQPPSNNVHTHFLYTALGHNYQISLGGWGMRVSAHCGLLSCCFQIAIKHHLQCLHPGSDDKNLKQRVTIMSMIKWINVMTVNILSITVIGLTACSSVVHTLYV